MTDNPKIKHFCNLVERQLELCWTEGMTIYEMKQVVDNLVEHIIEGIDNVQEQENSDDC